MPKTLRTRDLEKFISEIQVLIDSGKLMVNVYSSTYGSNKDLVAKFQKSLNSLEKTKDSLNKMIQDL